MRCLRLASAIALLLVGTASPVFATVWDMRTFFPNDARIKTHYLIDTFNEWLPNTSPVLFWYEYFDQYTFQQYNTPPGNRCHPDGFSWWSDNYLRYLGGPNGCGGDDTQFSPVGSFIYMPRYWDDSAPWSFSGTTTQLVIRNGVEICRGTNAYTQEILGWEPMGGGLMGIRFRTSQTITQSSGSCGDVPLFVENWWFITGLPVEGGGTDRALKRTMGGSLSQPFPEWDIWFDVWKRLPPLVNRDFDRDWRMDILWRNTGSGAVAIWLMNGTTVAASGSPGSASTDWQIAGVGDFNGDGKADILWRHTSGLVSIWLMNGTAIIGTGQPGSGGTDWQIAGVGDFSGDGKSDILWRQTTTGAVAIWVINGTTFVSGHTPGSRSTSWQIAGVGDFNGDGGADVLWRNTTTGMVSVWLMSGTSLASEGDAGTVPLDWTIASVGDLNGDQRADIVGRHTSGTVGAWLMSGSTIIGSGVVGTVTTDWQIQ